MPNKHETVYCLVVMAIDTKQLGLKYAHVMKCSSSPFSTRILDRCHDIATTLPRHCHDIDLSCSAITYHYSLYKLSVNIMPVFCCLFVAQVTKPIEREDEN